MKEKYFNLKLKINELNAEANNDSISVKQYNETIRSIDETSQELNCWAREAMAILRDFIRKHPDLYKRYDVTCPSRIHSVESRINKNAIAISGKNYWGEGDYSPLITVLIPLELLEDEEAYLKTRSEYVGLKDIKQIEKEIVEIKRKAKTCVYQLEAKENELKILKENK